MQTLKTLLAGAGIIGLFMSVTGTQTPEATGSYAKAAAYAKRSNGLAVLVMKDGKIVFEEYQNGFGAEKTQALASGTKSFSGAIAAAAVEDKLLTLDEKVSDTLPEWKTDPRKSRITLRHLLSLTSGLEPGRIGRPPAYAVALQAESRYEPGTHFEYGPIPYQIFGEVMRRKLAARKESAQESPVDYLKRRILNPIGLKVGFWRLNADGNPNMPSGAFLTAREWAKFGEFIRNGGAWQGKQLVSKKALEECFKGSKANPGYGLTFWLPAQIEKDKNGRILAAETARVEGGPKDIYMAAGAGKERLYVIPSKHLVIVRLARGGAYDDGEFLSLLLGIDRKEAKNAAPQARKEN